MEHQKDTVQISTNSQPNKQPLGAALLAIKHSPLPKGVKCWFKDSREILTMSLPLQREING